MTKNKWLICFLIVYLFLGLGCKEVKTCPPAFSGPPSQFCSSVEISPILPKGLFYHPVNLTTQASQQMMECFAWESFIALNWPAEANCRGTPDLDAKINDQQQLSVFDTLKATYELFQPTNSSWDPQNTSWHDPVPNTGSCGSAIIENASDIAPSMDQIIYQNSPPLLSSESVISDQNSQIVVYNVAFNQDVFEYIRQNNFAAPFMYSFSGPTTDNIYFPDNKTGVTGLGSMEIKTAWRVLTDEAECADYICRTAKVYSNDTGTCSTEILGLVGMHISRKVNNNPKWIWATFEHRYNTPEIDSIDDGPYHFYSDACTTLAPDNCNTTIVFGSTEQSEDYGCCENILIENSWLGTPNQLTRLQAIPALADLNERFNARLKKLDSPLQHYQLIGTQWAKTQSQTPDDFSRPCNPNGAWRVSAPDEGTPCYNMIPQLLRNAVIEGYNIANDASEEGGQSLTDSCINCHWATGIDGSFIWMDAMSNIYELDTQADTE